MARHTESVSSRKNIMSDRTRAKVLLLLAFLAACALLWFGYQTFRHPADRFAARFYRTASLTIASISEPC